MKATLTIEVPDDWKKGDRRCEYCYVNGNGFAVCDLKFCMECNADNCPLEIQYERNGDCETCKHYEYPACYCETECKYEPYIPTGSEGE